jgi:hypothetical protein
MKAKGNESHQSTKSDEEMKDEARPRQQREKLKNLE